MDTSNMGDIQRQLDENKAEHKDLMQEIKEIKTDVSEIKLMIAQLPEKFDERYAPKRLENWFYAGVGVILLAIITGLLNLVLK
jgi:DNA repair exonuclease SbcCD ATPase subunit